MPENKEMGVEQNLTPKEVVSSTEKPQTMMVDLEKNREVVIPREVKTWMQKLEEDPKQNQSNQNNDDDGLQSIAPTVNKIALPTDRETFTTGFGKPIDQAWRWLSEFVLRIVKQNKGKVKFKEE